MRYLILSLIVFISFSVFSVDEEENLRVTYVNVRILKAIDGDTLLVKSLSKKIKPRVFKIKMRLIEAPNIGRPFGRVIRNYVNKTFAGRKALAEFQNLKNGIATGSVYIVKGRTFFPQQTPSIATHLLYLGFVWLKVDECRKSSFCTERQFRRPFTYAYRRRIGLFEETDTPWDYNKKKSKKKKSIKMRVKK